MVKPEKFGHLHLVYHFIVPLRPWRCRIIMEFQNADMQRVERLTYRETPHLVTSDTVGKKK